MPTAISSSSTSFGESNRVPASLLIKPKSVKKKILDLFTDFKTFWGLCFAQQTTRINPPYFSYLRAFTLSPPKPRHVNICRAINIQHIQGRPQKIHQSDDEIYFMALWSLKVKLSLPPLLPLSPVSASSRSMLSRRSRYSFTRVLWIYNHRRAMFTGVV